jgi:protein-S-isoprenylcysteine O-methyltransferase Ste14
VLLTPKIFAHGAPAVDRKSQSARITFSDLRGAFAWVRRATERSPSMKATPWEFSNRFWIFGAFYWFGFALYSVDPVNAINFATAKLIAAGVPAKLPLDTIGVGIAAFFCFLCAMLRTWATSYLRTDVMQDASLHAEKIVADGPYRHMRNPLYLGGMLLAVGMGLLMSRTGFVFAVLGVIIFSLRLIGLEESNLLTERGASFAEYCRLVPRIIPSLGPRVPGSGIQPHWAQAFVGEFFMWGFFLGVLVFAITQNQKLFYIVIGLAVLSYVVRSYFVVRQNRKRGAA